MSNFESKSGGLAFSNALADAVESAAKYTVLVDARRRLPVSGVVYGPNLVLTADHGIEREEQIRVLLPDGAEISASLAGRDRGADLAVLRLEGQASQLASAEPASQAGRVGHLVLAVGRPSPQGVQASFGIINGLGSGLRTRHGGLIDQYLMTDALPLPGFSGGPLIDLAGQPLGINTSGLVRGASIAISARVAWQIAGSLLEHGHVRRGYVGIRSQVVDIPPQAREALGRSQATGLLVVGIEPEGPAAGPQGGGLMVGDILVGINGQPVADHDDLMSQMSGDLVGQEVPFEVLRGGLRQTVTIRVGERP